MILKEPGRTTSRLFLFVNQNYRRNNKIMMGSTSKKLPFLFLLIGGFSLLMQTVLLREFFVVFSANEITVSLVFAGWFFGIAFGALIGGKIAGKTAFVDSLIRLTLICFVVISIATLYALRSTRALFEVPAGELTPWKDFALAVIVFVTPVSFFVGFLFPLAGKAASRAGMKNRAIGALYAFESLGATIAGLLFTMLLVEKVRAFPLVFGASFVLLAGAHLTAKTKNRFVRYLPTFFALLILVCALLSLPGWLDSRSNANRFHAMAPGQSLLGSTDTRYRHLDAGRFAEQKNIFSNGEILTTVPDPSTHNIQAAIVACQHSAPRTLLLLGSGAQPLVRPLHDLGIERIRYPIADKEAYDFIERYLPEAEKSALHAPGFESITKEARVYLRENDEKFDVIWSHYGDPISSQINRFYTQEFFEAVKARLAVGGLFAFSITGGVNYVGDQVGMMAATLSATLKKVFRAVLVVPGDTTWFFASMDPAVPVDNWETMKARYAKLPGGLAGFSPLYFKTFADPARINDFSEALQSYAEAPINTELRPVTYFYTLQLWDRFVEGSVTGPFDLFRKIRPPVLIALIFLVGALFSVFVARLKKRRKRYRPLLAATTIAVVGATAMAIEIVILLLYQYRYGALYERIGLLIGLFMFGLFLGGAFSTFIETARGKNIHRMMVLLQVVLFAVIAVVAIGAGRPWSAVVFYLIMAVFGAVAGALFPLAAEFAGGRGESETGRLAGLIDFADHTGALFGAIVTGLVLIPLWGITATLIVLAAGNIAMVLVNVFFGKAEN